jgi:hypothetical protein
MKPTVQGTAFPVSNDTGLTKRDYFAAAALQALIASDKNINFDAAAKWAYQCADEMLKAREQ